MKLNEKQTIENFNKTKGLFFENINKIDKLLASLKKNTNYNYQEWKRACHYRSFRHYKDNKETL